MRAAPFVTGAALAALTLFIATRARAAFAPGFGDNMKIVFSTFRLSPTGVEMLKRLESFSATRYPDGQGYSIGYGHHVKPGETFEEPISHARGAALLRADVAAVERVLNELIEVPLYQWQFDALASFAYNVGVNALSGSTLVRKLNGGDVAGASAQFAVWNKTTKADGSKIVLAALVKRRTAERTLFDNAVYA